MNQLTIMSADSFSDTAKARADAYAEANAYVKAMATAKTKAGTQTSAVHANSITPITSAVITAPTTDYLKTIGEQLVKLNSARDGASEKAKYKEVLQERAIEFRNQCTKYKADLTEVKIQIDTTLREKKKFEQQINMCLDKLNKLITAVIQTTYPNDVPALIKTLHTAYKNTTSVEEITDIINQIVAIMWPAVDTSPLTSIIHVPTCNEKWLMYDKTCNGIIFPDDPLFDQSAVNSTLDCIYHKLIGGSFETVVHRITITTSVILTEQYDIYNVVNALQKAANEFNAAHNTDSISIMEIVLSSKKHGVVTIDVQQNKNRGDSIVEVALIAPMDTAVAMVATAPIAPANTAVVAAVAAASIAPADTAAVVAVAAVAAASIAPADIAAVAAASIAPADIATAPVDIVAAKDDDTTYLDLWTYAYKNNKNYLSVIFPDDPRFTSYKVNGYLDCVYEVGILSGTGEQIYDTESVYVPLVLLGCMFNTELSLIAENFNAEYMLRGVRIVTLTLWHKINGTVIDILSGNILAKNVSSGHEYAKVFAAKKTCANATASAESCITRNPPITVYITDTVEEQENKPVDKSVDKPVDKPVDKSTNQPMDKPVDKSTNPPMDKLTDMLTSETANMQAVSSPINITYNAVWAHAQVDEYGHVDLIFPDDPRFNMHDAGNCLQFTYQTTVALPTSDATSIKVNVAMPMTVTGSAELVTHLQKTAADYNAEHVGSNQINNITTHPYVVSSYDAGAKKNMPTIVATVTTVTTVDTNASMLSTAASAPANNTLPTDTNITPATDANISPSTAVSSTPIIITSPIAHVVNALTMRDATTTTPTTDATAIVPAKIDQTGIYKMCVCGKYHDS